MRPQTAAPAEAKPRRRLRSDARRSAAGLALALSTFETGKDGKPIPRSELMVLTRKGGQWHARSYTDPESNVFHKAFAVDAARRGAVAGDARRMRGGREALAEGRGRAWPRSRRSGRPTSAAKFAACGTARPATSYGDGQSELGDRDARPGRGGRASARTRARRPRSSSSIASPTSSSTRSSSATSIGDGVPEIYATPSEPNRSTARRSPARSCATCPARARAGRSSPTSARGTRRRSSWPTWTATAATSSTSRSRRPRAAPSRCGATTPAPTPKAGRVIATLYDPMCALPHRGRRRRRRQAARWWWPRRTAGCGCCGRAPIRRRPGVRS